MELENTDATSATTTLDSIKGVFVDSLRRNNKKIRDDRAIAIVEAAEMLYKRTVEDLELEIRGMKRDRDAMLDLSPTDANSLLLASDFNAKAFVQKDLELGVNIRLLEIKVEIARERYKFLFS